MPPTKMLVLDLETTGLDPRAYLASILELGAILVTRDVACTELWRASVLVRPAGSSSDHAALWAGMDPVVRDMHSTSGLWAAVTGPSSSAHSIGDTDDAIWRALREQLEPGELLQLAGSGVERFDRPWIEHFMPRLSTLLHYREMDISPVRELLSVAGRPEVLAHVEAARGRSHRALEDCDHELLELRAHLAWAAALPLPAVV